MGQYEGWELIQHFFEKGGVMMYVILGVSIVGTVIFVERVIDLYVMRRLASKAFIKTVMGHVEARRYRQALDVCQIKSRHPLVKVMRSGLLRANRREKEIERAMEKDMLEELPDLQKRAAFLALLANSATLLGLLGTIVGLIAAFNAVHGADAANKQAALSGGISVAMYTTMFGIGVAVPLLFFHHFTAKRSEKILMEVESGATSLLVALTGRVDSPMAATPPPTPHQVAAE
ncbi:MAG: biopolymer transport protein ExbB [Myxococcota bacterium]|jgi:biopolymer transport protein ExbB